MLYKKGSEWRKWDLHVHTPASYEYGYRGSDAYQKIADKIAVSDCVVFAISDYNTLEGYKNLKDNFDLKGKIILPAVEFRMKDLLVDREAGSPTAINFQIIFTDDLAVFSKIESFLLSVNFFDFNGHECLLRREDIVSLGKQANPAETDEEKLHKIGLSKIRVNFDDIVDCLDKKGLKDHSLILIPFDEYGGIDRLNSISEGLIKSNFIKRSHIVGSGALLSIQYFLGKSDRYTREEFKSWIGEPKPCIKGSDSHNPDSIGIFPKDQHGVEKCCWIKADSTFEGLKQILWEPKERVRIQERNPGDSKSERLVIDCSVYKSSLGVENIVYFNRELNSIIGIRGSGKSTLLKNIASKVDNQQFNERDKKQPYPLDSFKVIWADNEEDSGTEESPKSIFYIPQNYLSALAYEDGEKAAERDQFLTELLKKNAKFENAIQAYENFVSTNKIKIEELIQRLIAADTALKETRRLLKKQGAKAEIEKEIKKKNEDIKKYKDATNTGITEDELKKYTQSRKVVSDSESRVAVLSQDKKILTGLLETGANILVANQEFTLLSKERQELIRSELIKKGKESFIDLIKMEIEKINQQIGALDKAIKENQAVVKGLDERIKKSKALEDLTKELGDLQKTFERIDEYSKKIKRAEDDCRDAIQGLVSAYDDFKNQQNSIYNTITFDEKFSFLKVEIVAAYNTQQLRDFIERNINTRDTNPALKSNEDIKKLFGESPDPLVSDTVQKLIFGLLDGDIKIKVEAGDLSLVLAQLLRNRYEIDYLNSVKTKDDVPFKNMTGGQKAIALLELVFRFDDEKYPILIDQPEDDLDVSGVAADLVDFIKNEKQERQIIIVSHNAGLVICADSEEVIVSTSDRLTPGKYDFTYFTGAIENPEIRENIIKILEGGREALKQRARKLNFKGDI